MNKTDLRLRMREKRRVAKPDMREGRTAVRLIRLPVFAEARLVACYMAFPGESPTVDFMEHGHAAGKRLCVPAWCPATGRYGMAFLKKDEELVEGPLKIPQPRRPAWVCPRMIDMIVVPGLAFDGFGGRLGHGGGHYDRILARISPRTARVGLCHDWQIVSRIPVDPWDEPVQWVVSEKRTIRCARDARG